MKKFTLDYQRITDVLISSVKQLLPPKLRKWLDIKLNKFIIDKFHKKYHGVFQNTFWLGTPALKCPFDLWIYQEIIYDLKPDIIIESGTYHGGSALFLASICDLLNHGLVLTIDVANDINRTKHSRIVYLIGSSVSKDTLRSIKSYIKDDDKVMVVLDSKHDKKHVLRELKIYSKIVTRDSYLIVEDTNLNGHPVWPDFGPGPMEAVREFLTSTDDFIIDKEKEKHYLTFNPDGYLKRIR
jgi:cephalosporin hydroxylase